jgi:N-acetylglucosaminyl-diphospho-decaprenol L-rhamnosyltransferase
MSISLIIVTYNSQKFLPQMLKAIHAQTLKPLEILIVDSGSADRSYLEEMGEIKVIYAPKDVGFCVANNIGFRHLSQASRYVLFLNPDAFLEERFLEKAHKKMEEKAFLNCAVLTGTLYGYDIHAHCPTECFDSRAIFCTPYGRWYDRDQGKRIYPLPQREEKVEAICGALMFCRKSALEKVSSPQNAPFNESFYMYKEDIELSIRLRKACFDLYYCPELSAYHCRGWSKKRRDMPRFFRLLSAKNELTINTKISPLKAAYSLCKYFLVKVLDF